MSEWKEYTGSDEQIAEMHNDDNGWIVTFYDGTQSEIHKGYPGKSVNMHAIQKYLICNPHPLADMICQQARTGQPVWVKTTCIGYKPCEFGGDEMYSKQYIYSTTTPDWNIPNAEYSFTEFKEEV